MSSCPTSNKINPVFMTELLKVPKCIIDQSYKYRLNIKVYFAYPIRDYSNNQSIGI